MKIGKYELDSNSMCQTKIASLGVATDEDGNEYPTHKHCIVKLGYIVLEQGEYDEEGEQTKAPVLSEKYHVDVMWDLTDTYDEEGNIVKAQHPDGWGDYAVNVEGKVAHSFFGVDYQQNKI